MLDKGTIAALLRRTPPLIEGAIDLSVQIQPNGVDLTLRGVAGYSGAGRVDFSNAGRALAEVKQLSIPEQGLSLEPGAYLVTFNEVVHLPKDIAALGRTRSTLLRCGAALHTAVWDAGYSGRSQSLMTVYNPLGITLLPNARIMQLVFFRLEQSVPDGYSGRYQGENV